ncbi:putative naringenin-chalcone synthase [Lipingzhangella halophila]|uniref:Putative naringenin-chalcone synthase n=1 Tax=Lipingzhangella halophila TaxID=1783352 RepID=A0A7W7W5F4_9ACTN|nr:type III polyketide synthase [Lipingzhangella halophila]MBB4935172.1 putative naringenin-chalcone synthase [Lipingzhangella halophila]
MTSARITGTGTAFPPTALAQGRLPELLPAGHPNADVLHRIVESSGIRRRRLVVDPDTEDVSSWGTRARMRRFQQEALPLAHDALADALAAAGTEPGEVGLLCVVSSTGYQSPGVDSRLIRELGMSPATQRMFVGHMGCYAALPGLAACVDFARCHPSPAALLNVELSSLHLQPPPWDTEQLVINTLFGDGAVAMVVQGADRPGRGPAVVDVASYTDVEHEDHMTWEVGDTGFPMGLSPKIPDLIAARLPEVVRALLGPHDLTAAEVGWWAVHPGGAKIIEAAEESLALAPEATAASRAVLAEYGNCSSAGLPIVLAELQRTNPLPPGEPGVAMTFGPGLTLYTALLRGG